MSTTDIFKEERLTELLQHFPEKERIAMRKKFKVYDLEDTAQALEYHLSVANLDFPENMAKLKELAASLLPLYDGNMAKLLEGKYGNYTKKAPAQVLAAYDLKGDVEANSFYGTVPQGLKKEAPLFDRSEVKVPTLPLLPFKVDKPGFYRVDVKSYDVKVEDGDTVRINGTTFRLTGMDTLELDQGPLASLAKQRLKEYIAEAATKDALVIKVGEKDRHGRTVGQLAFADGTDIHYRMIRDGLAVYYDKYNKELSETQKAMYREAHDHQKQLYEEGKGKVHNVHAYTNPEQFRRENETLSGQAHNPEIYERQSNSSDAEAGLTFENSTSPEVRREPGGRVTSSGFRVDDPIDDGGVRENLKRSALISHLSRLYDHYYTGADVTVWMKSDFSPNRVMVDLIAGIGYNYQITSVPIYGIGSRFPMFFSRGNALGTGSIILPFKHKDYLKNMVKYVNNEFIPNQAEIDSAQTIDPYSASDANFEKAFIQNQLALPGSDIIDIGAIVSPFDLEIRFDNTNAFSVDPTKSAITLKGCKIIGEASETASTRDGTIYVTYNFLFRNIVGSE